MVTPDIKTLKEAARKIHAAYAARRSVRPGWKRGSMEVISDIVAALAVKDDKWVFDHDGDGAVLAFLADAVVDTLYVVEDICPDWETGDTEIEKLVKVWSRAHDYNDRGEITADYELFAVPGKSFAEFGYDMTYAVATIAKCYHADAPHLLVIPVFLLLRFCEARGWDLWAAVDMRLIEM